MPAVAIVVAGVIAAGASIYSANKSAKAQKDAASSVIDNERYIFDRNTELNDPFYQVGKNALPGLAGWDAANPLPSFDEIVNNPMEGWKYEQSPAYMAKYGLASRELNNQLQARGLTSGGLGAVKATDLSRRMTADDYAKEREYKRGSLVDSYKSRYSENTDRYNRILDQVKLGTGASTQMGAAGNQYAQGVGRATMAAGAADADFYSGLAGMPLQAANLGLKTYDTGRRGGWWNDKGSTPDSGLGSEDFISDN